MQNSFHSSRMKQSNRKKRLNYRMKKKLLALAIVAFSAVLMVSCSKADRVSHNLSREADELNITRRVTVINGITNQIIFQATGQMSIEYVEERKQLNIIALGENGEYKKHIVGISDNVSYMVEDITGMKGVDTKYRLYFNPDMIVPIEVKTAK